MRFATRFRRAMRALVGPSSGLTDPSGWFVNWLGGGSDTKSGVRVTPDTALALSAVYASIRVRSETIGALPLNLMREQSDGSRVVASDHHLHGLVKRAPHPQMTAMEWTEMLVGHIDLRGNAYAQIVRDRGGRIRRLTPLHPDKVTVQRSTVPNEDGVRPLVYQVTNDAFGTQQFGEDEILHLRSWSQDGAMGISPIMAQREPLGLAIATDTHAARSFANDARPGGVLQHPGKMKPEAVKNFRESWNALHGGPENRGKVAILEEGMTWQAMSLTNEQAQLLESRRYSRSEIAAIWRVPPHLIGDLERATWGNIEQQAIDFAQNCILSTCIRIEQRLNLSLLTEEERESGLYFKFNLGGLLRGDTKQRYESYQIGRANGWLSVNEIRSLEDMNRIEGGDTYLTPSVATQNGQRSPLEPVLLDTLERAFRREAKGVRALVKRSAGASEIEDYYRDHHRYLIEALSPIDAAWRKLGSQLPVRALADDIVARSLGELRTAKGEDAERALVVWETLRAADYTAEIMRRYG